MPDNEQGNAGSSTTEEQEEKWYERITWTDILLFLGLIFGLKFSLDYFLKNSKSIAQSGLALGKAIKEWALFLLKSPWIVWPLRLYFLLLPLCALIFWLLGFPTLAYLFAVAQMTVIILTTFVLTVFIRHGSRTGLFFRMTVALSLIEFCLISILNFFFLLPVGLLSAAQMINAWGLLVAFIPLAVIIQARWQFGWALVFLLSALPLILTIIFPSGWLEVWIGERQAYQGYVGVILTSPLQAYTARGESVPQIFAAGDTLYADFHVKKKIGKKLYAFRCYSDFPEGKETYLPLIRGVNYYKVDPVLAKGNYNRGSAETYPIPHRKENPVDSLIYKESDSIPE